MIFTGQADASVRHFTDDLSVNISAQGHKSSHTRKRGEIPILIRLQDGDRMASLSMQAGEERGGHALAIYDHARDLAVSRVLFIPLQKCGDAHGEMLVSAMGSDEQGMAVLVVQQQERPAAQNHAQTPNQSAWDEHLTVDRLAVSIYRSRVSAQACLASPVPSAGCQSWVAQHARTSVKRSAPSARAICDKKASVYR